MPRRKATRELVTSCCPGSQPRRSKGAQRSANALVSAMFGVAHDVYRFTCFLFLPLLFAGLALLQRRGGATMLAVLGAVSVRLMVLQRDTFETIAVKVLTDVDGNGIPFVRPDIVGDIVPKVIPALPWTSRPTRRRPWPVW